MKVVIIEDEKILANKLEEYLSEIDTSIEVLAKIGTVRDATNWLNNNEADLLFLDIQLSDGLSFDIFEQVDISTPVIFTTAYDQYAIKAFKNNGIDYLLKPISFDELRKSIEKYKDLFRNQTVYNPDFKAMINALKKKSESYKKRFTINVGSKIRIINTDDIAYFYSTNKAVFLRTINNQDFDVDYSLTKLENLDLGANQLKSLPTNFENLQNLRRLVLVQNSFTKIPSVICNIESLEFLYLFENPIKSLPICIKNLTNLREFSFDSENLEVIPDFFKEMHSLVYLGSKYNYKYFPKTLIEYAQQYCKDPKSLTQEEKDYLIYKSSILERILLEANLPPTDPILSQITKRMTTISNSGLEILR